MNDSIQREIVFPHAPDDVWRALTDSDALTDWLMPNDFEPRVGHRFTFRTEPNPQAGFDGIVHCEVLECSPPSRLTYSWAGGSVASTVTYRLEPVDDGTKMFFEQSGFDVSQPWSEQAIKGAEYGWTRMLGRLEGVITALAPRS